jgi:hypothetical protein
MSFLLALPSYGIAIGLNPGLNDSIIQPKRWLASKVTTALIQRPSNVANNPIAQFVASIGSIAAHALISTMASDVTPGLFCTTAQLSVGNHHEILCLGTMANWMVLRSGNSITPRDEVDAIRWGCDKLPEIPRLLVLEFRAVVPRVPRAYSALFRGDGNSAFGRSGCADHARNSRIYCADREIAQLLIIGYKYKMLCTCT